MDDVQRVMYIVAKIYSYAVPVISMEEYRLIMSVDLELPHHPEIKKRLVELREIYGKSETE